MITKTDRLESTCLGRFNRKIFSAGKSLHGTLFQVGTQGILRDQYLVLNRGSTMQAKTEALGGDRRCFSLIVVFCKEHVGW